MATMSDKLVGDLFGVTDEDRARWDAMKESRAASRHRAEAMNTEKEGPVSRMVSRGLDLAERGIFSQLTADQIDQVQQGRIKREETKRPTRLSRSKAGKSEAEDDFQMG